MHAARCTLQTADCSRQRPGAVLPTSSATRDPSLLACSVWYGCTGHGARSSCFEDLTRAAPPSRRKKNGSRDICRSACAGPSEFQRLTSDPASLHPAFPPATCDLLQRQPPKAERYQTTHLDSRLSPQPTCICTCTCTYTCCTCTCTSTLWTTRTPSACAGELRRSYLSVSVPIDHHETSMNLPMLLGSLVCFSHPPFAPSSASLLFRRVMGMQTCRHANMQTGPLTTWTRWPIAA